MAARIGLSGGIGSGKSTVLGFFEEAGVPVFSADQIARKLTQPGQQEFDQIVELFGKTVLTEEGLIDRAKLGAEVFSDQSRLKLLEAILHPGIRKALLDGADQDSSPYCILEVPLLFESDLYKQMDQNIAIICDEKIRLERVSITRGKSKAFIKSVIKTQVSDELRAELADFLLDNNGDLQHLDDQVQYLRKQLGKQYI